MHLLVGIQLSVLKRLHCINTAVKEKQKQPKLPISDIV